MKKIVVRLMAILLCILIASPAQATPEGEYNQAIRQQEALQQQLDDLKTRISGIELEKEAMLETAAAYQEQINECQSFLDVLDTQLSELESTIGYKYQEFEDKLHIFHMHLRYMEENGSSAYWTLLLSADNLIALLNRIDLIYESIAYQEQTLSILEQQIADLVALEQGISNLRADSNYAAQKIKSLQHQLYKQIEDRIAQLQMLDEENSAITEELIELRQISTDLLNRINGSDYDGTLDPVLLYQRYVVQTGESARTPLGARIVNAALQYVGGEYVWGGATPDVGFDCSGLMYYIYGQFGYQICRTARPQFKYDGRTVDFSELQAGDMVFFHPPGDPEISHVGMYIGGGMFVHAANSRKGIIVSSLYSTYYKTNFAGAKRIV